MKLSLQRMPGIVRKCHQSFLPNVASSVCHSCGIRLTPMGVAAMFVYMISGILYSVYKYNDNKNNDNSNNDDDNNHNNNDMHTC